MQEPITITEPQPTPKYAGFWRRVAAYFIDSAILLVPVISGLITIGIIGAIFPNIFTHPVFRMILSAVIWLYSLVTIFAYFAGFESSKLQATPGKLALHIKVTDINGNRLSYARALARTWSIHIATWFLFLGIFMILWTKKKQGLQDMIANCLVLNNNQPEPTFTTPPDDSFEQAK